METILYLIVGLILGIVIGYFLANAKRSSAQSEMAVLSEKSKRSENELITLKELLDRERTNYNNQLRQLESEKGRFEESARRIPILEEELKTLQETGKNLKVQNAALTERYLSEKENLELRLTELKEAKESLTKEFENIANKIFESKNQTFTEQSKQNLESLLKPFKENISEFKSRVENIYTEETRERSSLRTEINTLRDLNLQLNEGAKNLTNALKGDKKMQGTWGELILERIFEVSGLTKGSEYKIQVSGIGVEGARYQPDAIIYLPDNKQIIVDAKTSLVAYERYYSMEDESLKKRALVEHIAAIEKHINDLSGKEYYRLEGVTSLDYVLMFIPIEPAFDLLMQESPDTYNRALDKNIIIVTRTTLLVTLKTISSIWKTEKRNQNAILIANKVQDFLKKLERFVENFEEVGKALDKAQRVYSEANGQLRDGRGNLTSRGHEIAKLGGFQVKKLTAGDDPFEEEDEEKQT